MKNLQINLPKTVFAHNIIFLFFFFAAPKIYLVRDFGLRPEDALYPLTFLLFLLVLPRLERQNNKNLGKFNRAVIAYFAYVFVQGLILSSYTGGLKYLAAISLKQLQYFIFFYLLLYTFQFSELKDKTLKCISFLVGITLTWALIQIVLGHRAHFSRGVGHQETSYGIGAIGENFPHQAAAIFLFCFIFSYFYTKIRFRKALMALAAVSVFMTGSRTTIAALLVCIIYVIITHPAARKFFKKPVPAMAFAAGILIFGLATDQALTNRDVSFYNNIKTRLTISGLSHGIDQRFRVWESRIISKPYSTYSPLSSVTGMGRGYVNTRTDAWMLTADSGYLRDFLEIGILGTFLHFLIFFRAGQCIGFRKYLVVLLPYISLSITTEVLLLARSGMLILILSAVLLHMDEKQGRETAL